MEMLAKLVSEMGIETNGKKGEEIAKEMYEKFASLKKQIEYLERQLHYKDSEPTDPEERRKYYESWAGGFS